MVEVPLRRLPAWLAGFVRRHGAWTRHSIDDPPGWDLRAADGASAAVVRPQWLTGPVGELDPEALAALAPAYGLVAVRRAGYAVAQFDGSRLLSAKVGHRHIHGRTAAGGWSQQRYARRRDNQADEVAGAAAATANRMLGPVADSLAFLVTGGDRRLLAIAMGQVVRPLAALPVERHIAMGTPTAQVVAGLPAQVLAVRIRVLVPDAEPS